MKESVKKNNKGSTLIIVLVVVAFVAVLGTVSITVAMLNFKMKEIDRESKKTFYTAEEAVDQLYAGLGRASMECLENCYNKQMQSITRQSTNGAPGKSQTRSVQTNNKVYNTELRIDFMREILGRLFTSYIWNENSDVNLITDTQNKESLCDMLDSYLMESDKNKLRVESVGDISVNKIKNSDPANFKLEIKNCSITYQNQQGYLSNVTIDCNVGLPDVEIQFVEDSHNTLFEAFSLIGCKGVMVGDSHTLNVIGTKIFAGGGSANGGLELGNGAVLNANTSTLVSSSSIRVGSAPKGTIASGAKLNLSEDSRLWCNDLETGESSKNCSMNLEGSVFVQDDLTVNGEDNTVKIPGNYIGWSYEGVSSVPEGHTKSSAMIVNGKGSTLDLSDIKSLILGGQSYIDMLQRGGGSSYMTGESVSLRADQEVYLVPDRFLKNSEDESSYYRNPVADNASKNLDVQIPSTYFAKNWLDDSFEYTTDTVDGLTYYYLNIKKEYIDDFVHAILDPEKKNDPDIAACQNLLKKNLLQLQQQSWINNNSDANIYSNGALVRAKITDGEVTVLSEAQNKKGDEFTKDHSMGEGTEPAVGADSFKLTSIDLNNRYALVSRVLFEPPFFSDGTALSGKQSLTKGTRSIYADYPITIIKDDGTLVDIHSTTDNIYTNFVNEGYLRTQTTGGAKAYTASDGSDFKVYITSEKMLYVDGTVQPGHVDIADGLIITDGSVVVSKDFNGIIFAGGTITVDNSVRVTNSYEKSTLMFSKLSETDRKEVQNFLVAWNKIDVTDDKTGDIPTIEGVTYKNIIDFSNWRKSGVKNETGKK